jgi:diguanylate cyclase (GGDEF)-like protein
MFKNTLKNNIYLYQQIDILFKASISGGLLNIFAVWLIFVLVYGSPHQDNAFWLSLSVTSVALIRIFVTNSYLRKQEKNLSFYLAGYLILTLALGCIWGIFEYSQASHNDESVRNMIFLINFGLIAGGVAILSVWLPAYLVYILPQAIAIFLVFITIESGNRHYLAFTFLIFIVVMISTSLKVNMRRKHELELIVHNEQLISDLNDEIQIREKVQLELEDNKRQLECKVNERTKDLQEINANLKKTIEKKEKAEDSLQYLAYHDELTGLPNRNLLIDRINHSIETAYRNKQPLGVLFLDLDRFKTINDSLGHLIGDKLIIEVSKRLIKTLRKEDTISRNGGDEFVIVIQRMVSSEEIIGIAQKVIDNLTRIFDIDSHKIHIGSSIGVSLYPGDGRSGQELIRNADTAMFSAKKAGGNRLQFYDESMSNRLHERLQIEAELHTAIENDEFSLVYQPQIDCHNGVTTGFEALLRWNNKKLGAVPPNQFIPLLEETGLIYDVGKWVVKTVIEFIRDGNIGNSVIAINLSALQCGDMQFVDFIGSTIETAGIPPSQLEFEITESLLINDFIKTESFLNEIHELGCSIALDDFGTGYTSMSYLTRLPIDCIKVDQSFIRGIDTSDTLVNIVKAIVNMSKSLGVKNVFEGVETVAELEVIKSLDGSIVQGYLFSKPLTSAEIKPWIVSIHTTFSDYQEKLQQNN